jgi:hypothetical protein
LLSSKTKIVSHHHSRLQVQGRHQTHWLVLYSIHSCQPNHHRRIHSWDSGSLGSSNQSSSFARGVGRQVSRCRSSSPLTFHSIHSIQSMRIVAYDRCSSIGCMRQSLPRLTGPLLRYSQNKTITMALLCCHGIMVRRTIAACDIKSNRSINGNASYSLTNLSWVLVGSLQWNHFHLAVATALRDSFLVANGQCIGININAGIPQFIRSGKT